MIDSVAFGFWLVDRQQRMRRCLVHPTDLDALVEDAEGRARAQTGPAHQRFKDRAQAWRAMAEAIHAEQQAVD